MRITVGLTHCKSETCVHKRDCVEAGYRPPRSSTRGRLPHNVLNQPEMEGGSNTYLAIPSRNSCLDSLPSWLTSKSAQKASTDVISVTVQYVGEKFQDEQGAALQHKDCGMSEDLVPVKRETISSQLK